MKSWENLEPDVYRLMNKHYTPGRGGRKIRYLVRHHTAGVLTTDQVWNVWQSRQASAHYIVEPSGRIGQLVNDWDTAWANGNATANAESITIEHSNSPGPDYPISDATIEEGAHLAAALCVGYGLGRPQFGVNIRDHREFYGTSCPYHLANGGKYHARYMQRAQYWFDQMTKNPAPAPAPTNPKETTMSDPKIALILDQLAGHPGDKFPGWPQLGGRTLVDAVAAIGAHLEIDGFTDTKEGRK